MASLLIGNSSKNRPILDVNNYDNKCKQMKVVFEYQNVLDIVKSDVDPLCDNPTYAQRIVHKKIKKNDFKALFIINQCVDPTNFEELVTLNLQSMRYLRESLCYSK
jgi:hypothetical protein